MKKIIKNNSGLTLIELLVSVTILAFVVIAFLNLFVYGTSYVARARQKSSTSSEAQSSANTFLDDGTGTDITTASSVLTIHLVSGSTIEVDVTEATITKPDGNQTSTIVTMKP